MAIGFVVSIIAGLVRRKRLANNKPEHSSVSNLTEPQSTTDRAAPLDDQDEADNLLEPVAPASPSLSANGHPVYKDQTQSASQRRSSAAPMASADIEGNDDTVYQTSRTRCNTNLPWLLRLQWMTR